VVVLAVLAQVGGEVVDALGEQRDLHAGAAGVLGVGAEPRDDLGLLFLGQRRHERRSR
jgi:hypothetical protein